MNKKTSIPLLLLPFLASSCANNEDLVFTTFTKTGVDFSAVDGVPVSGTFGYKRFEGAIIPVDPTTEDEAHSVFASIDMNNRWLGGIDVTQLFATGEAAINTAKNPNGLKKGLQPAPEDQNNSN